MASDKSENATNKKEKPAFAIPYDQWFEEKGGAYWLPTFLEREKDIRALDVKSGDVWIVTVPKSGTTWMQEMVWLLTHNLDFEGAKALLKYRSPGLEGCWTHKFFINHDVPLSEFERLASHSGGRRVLKTHLQYDFLPDKLRDPNTPGKIIFVARNPKDACVSYYHFHNLYPFDIGCTMEEFCHYYMEGKYVAGPYWRQVMGFWNLRNNKNVLFVKYEDMKKDLEKVVREVATFVEEPIPQGEQMKALLNHLSFGAMKKNPAVNREQGEGTLRNDQSAEDGRFIRKGIVGGWKQALSPELIQKFDKWIADNTKGTDLCFDESA